MPRITRRELGTSLTAALLAPTTATSRDEKKSDLRAQTADALLEIVKLRYGNQLTGAKLESIRTTLLSGLSTAERLRKVGNSSEPAFVYHAELS